MKRIFDEQDEDTQVLVLVKGAEQQERYVFIFDNTKESREEVLRVFGRFASSTELSFSWYDAAVLSQKVRKSATQA